MHAVKLLHSMIKKSLVGIHSKRINAVFVAVNALVSGTKLSLTGLGRSIKSGAKVKNNIKLIDRLLANEHLYTERTCFYHKISHLLIGSVQNIPIIIDWSSLPNKDCYLLRAALPSKGRALTLYEEVHPSSKQNNHKVHKDFLRSLSKVIPKNCKPIITTDAGFHAPFFREVEQLGWDWVGRIRNLTKYKELNTDDWFSCKDLHQSATKAAKYICKVILSKSTPISCSIFTYKGKKMNRIDKNQSGIRKKGKYSRTCAKANKEPWVLATSLIGGRKIAKKVISIYKRRMQIEEGFRDIKNSRLGFGLEHSKTYMLKRFEILLLIAMLAIMAVCLTGKIAEQKNMQFDFQANTVRNRSVLSIFFLGCQIINQGSIQFKKSELITACSLLSQAITNGLEG